MDLGFNIEIPGLTIGLKSGMQHHFSLIAKKQVGEQEIVIALDHAVSESEVQTSPLILYIYKISEVKVDVPIFIAIPQLNETARKIAEGNEILLIEGSTSDQEVIENIRAK
jgi:pyridoxal biosynthesis lyase PdxS